MTVEACPDIEAAVERVTDFAVWFDCDVQSHLVNGSVAREHASDLRALLSERKALRETQMSANNLPPRKWVEAILNAITAARVDGIMGSDSLSSIVYAIEAARKIEALQRSREAPGREEVARIIDPWAMDRAECDPETEAAREEALTKADAILALFSSSPTVEGWRPTHRHVKRGTTYKIIAEGLFQTAEQAIWDETPLTIYCGEDGSYWARPTTEFRDGRFEPLPAPTTEGK
ncbi:hypothetical protein LJR164_001581 [Phenylobacterium sp. LjRoot164]|uniref:hypothetical protein n=1 Tax=unclassified Phenylobacterium TaxID=2640670 RepID=UPI003ED0B7FE